VSEKELLQIDKLATKAKMSRSEYLIKSALNKEIVVIEGGDKAAYHLSKIGGNINGLKILAHQGKIQIIYLNEFTEEVRMVWQLLSSSINRTELTQE
jgi:dTDP-4-amino-4,6-dideoxygalactose transaminase